MPTIGMTTILTWLGAQPGAVYPDAFGRREDIQDIIELWAAADPA